MNLGGKKGNEKESMAQILIKGGNRTFFLFKGTVGPWGRFGHSKCCMKDV